MTPLLHVSQLKYQYPGGVDALKGVDFSLAVGEHVALLGPNGAGKSTLIQHLNGILMGDGEVRVGEIRVERQTLREIRRRVGIVFQDPDDQLFCATIEEDVAFGPRNFGIAGDALAQRVQDALAAVDLLDKRLRPPFQLSGGERRRAALATVLSCQPDLVVMDEPSANLDPRHRRQLIGWIKAYPGAILVATHDLDLALEATSRSLLIDGGRVVADAPSSQLLRDQTLLEAHGLELPLRLQGWP